VTHIPALPEGKCVVGDDDLRFGRAAHPEHTQIHDAGQAIPKKIITNKSSPECTKQQNYQ
jgi:hypothetical protein